jgi:hypothetical protein
MKSLKIPVLKLSLLALVISSCQKTEFDEYEYIERLVYSSKSEYQVINNE